MSASLVDFLTGVTASADTATPRSTSTTAGNKRRLMSKVNSNKLETKKGTASNPSPQPTEQTVSGKVSKRAARIALKKQKKAKTAEPLASPPSATKKHKAPKTTAPPVEVHDPCKANPATDTKANAAAAAAAKKLIAKKRADSYARRKSSADTPPDETGPPTKTRKEKRSTTAGSKKAAAPADTAAEAATNVVEPTQDRGIPTLDK